MRYSHKQQSQPVLGRDFITTLADNNATASAALTGSVAIAGPNGATLPPGPAAEAAVRGRVHTHRSGEHYFQRPLYSTEAGVVRLTGEVETVWYPSLYSVWRRMQAAQQAGASGVSVWECGQGLDYFFQLF